MRLLIVDGHAQVRAALARRLHRRQDATVLAAVGNVTAGARLVAELIPDVVLCEPRTMGVDPVAAVRRLVAAGAPVAVWTSSLVQGEAEAFRRAGAAATLLKDTNLSGLIAALLPLVPQGAPEVPTNPAPFPTRRATLRARGSELPR